MQKELFDILLQETEAEPLIDDGIIEVEVYYYFKKWNNLFGTFIKGDVYKKTLSVYNWVIFRDGIIKNVFNKGLCKIKFIR